MAAAACVLHVDTGHGGKLQVGGGKSARKGLGIGLRVKSCIVLRSCLMMKGKGIRVVPGRS